uniref:Uncharacterized protein n=1 Tax=Strigamia maritima TaxID=126957 RepID=T1JAL1_STRMM
MASFDPRVKTALLLAGLVGVDLDVGGHGVALSVGQLFPLPQAHDSRRLFLGAVGSWYWQGQVFAQDLEHNNDLLATNEGPDTDDDTYLGYSAAVGEFSGDGDLDVVIGMPRGSNLTGKVVVFGSRLFNLHNITGEQMGSYFGYSVCVVDVNADGLDDIVVGAPFYSELGAKDGSFETGRVYVIYQDTKHQFKRRHLLDGRDSRARFGLSLTSAGDINRDGFGDFVVGAPYGGENGRGTVYIFHGSKEGIKVKPSQVVFAEDLDSTLSTFGFSLSGGLDLDINEYPDLLVGAYDSHKVLLLKSRPVVSVTASLTVNPEKINLDEKGCSLLDGTPVSCVVIHSCLEYSGVGVSSKLEFEFVTKLDVLKAREPRVFFLTSEQDHRQKSTAILQKESIHCQSIFIYIKSAVQDKLTPIMVEVNYSLVDRRLESKDLKPILDQNVKSNLKKKSISIQKDCGKDNVCIPDLVLSCEPNPTPYVMGTQKRLELQINIVNAGEDAFETTFYIEIPPGVDYINVDQISTNVPVSCTTISLSSSHYQCDVGNPLKAKETVTFMILLAPKYLNSSNNEYEFLMEVNSTNPENVTTEYNNMWLIRVPVDVKAELIVSGISKPDIVLYNKTIPSPVIKTHEIDIGPEIVHIYDVWNQGPSTIREVQIYILWPSYTLTGQNLLYLLEQPETSSLGRCEYVPNVNSLNLTIERISSFGQASSSVMKLEDFFNTDYDNSSDNHLARHRRRRDADDLFERELSCGSTLCSQIVCTAQFLKRGNHAYFKIRSRLWTSSLKTLGFDELKITSKIVSRITSLPSAVQEDILEPKVHVIETVVSPADVAAGRKQVPWWIIAAAVCMGMLLLSILVIVLWKLGFFLRKRPRDEVERYPLNKPERNGKLVNGDELL